MITEDKLVDLLEDAFREQGETRFAGSVEYVGLRMGSELTLDGSFDLRKVAQAVLQELAK